MALLFFAAIFGGLGVLVARRLRRATRARTASRAPAVAGWALFLVPVSLVYLTSLDGFYDVHTTSEGVQLRYAVPMVTNDIRWRDVRRIEAVPQYRGTWRLRIVTESGTFESATARRDVVENARAAMMARRGP